jgi:hypothetical protein
MNLKKWLFLAGSLGLTSCAVFNPYPKYAPKFKERESLLNIGKANVTMNIIHHEFGSSEDVLTQWRKLNDDYSEGELIAITGGKNLVKRVLAGGSREPKTVMLPEGTYVLANLEISKKNTHYFIQSGVPWWKRTGWDLGKKQPKVASFHLKAGENVTLPTIQVSIDQGDKDNMRFVFDVEPDPEGLWTFGDWAIVHRK